MPVGDIVHIEGLYVKTHAVKTNINITKGDFCIDDSGLRPVLTGDFSGDDRFFDIGDEPVYQAAHDANNLTTTPVADRVSRISVLSKGSDWVCKVSASIKPDDHVGISRLDSRTPKIAVSEVANAAEPSIEQSLGIYKHKEFAQTAANSALNDDAVIKTGAL